MTIKIWDLTINTNMSMLEDQNNQICSIDFTRDGKLLAAGSLPGTVKIWDLATCACVRTLYHDNVLSKLDGSYGNLVVCLPDGRRLAFLSDYGISIWDPATGMFVSEFYISPDAHARLIAFIDNSPLLTNRGVLVLDSYTGTNPASSATSKEEMSLLGYGLSDDGAYIMKGENRMIWLPSEYRSDHTAVVGGTIVIVCGLGRMGFIRSSIGL
ncbi:Vegetative incompatibility protein HET-E-1-like protein 21 [Colletotrichum chlorophyti]|uniref:Mitochondrial division protein 1 n=1 Tax=Colletotrichum chlorophyti TaxID=708187 RepID=A0A1Q8RWZ8_9PEZI|nr:Vegetative incompatibility protein HET-E-1-like protein 21 [Colletotrichum chlorophyti]